MIEGAGSGWAAPAVPVTAAAAKPAMEVRTPRRETPHSQPDMQRSKRMAPSLGQGPAIIYCGKPSAFALPLYFRLKRPYNPRRFLKSHRLPGGSLGRPLPIQEHHAPQGAA